MSRPIWISILVSGQKKEGLTCAFSVISNVFRGRKQSVVVPPISPG